jgi:hypothetical protein
MDGGRRLVLTSSGDEKGTVRESGIPTMQLRNEVMNRRSSRGHWKSDIELQLIGVGKGMGAWSFFTGLLL